MSVEKKRCQIDFRSFKEIIYIGQKHQFTVATIKRGKALFYGPSLITPGRMRMAHKHLWIPAEIGYGVCTQNCHGRIRSWNHSPQ
jgi:hypothetical protein